MNLRFQLSQIIIIIAFRFPVTQFAPRFTFKFSISLDNVNISLVPQTLIASANFNFSSNLRNAKGERRCKAKGQVRRLSLLSGAYLTVAAT